jgi:ribosomal protein S6--L-glutamate ligase
MHIGILTARGRNYHPNRRLLGASSTLGHRVTLIHPKTCLSEVQGSRLGVLGSTGLRGIDVLLPRIGATINEYALGLVRHFELGGLRVVNGFHSILLARNKFLTLQTLVSNGIPVPRSYYVSNFENFHKAVAELGGYPVVAKTPNSRQGSGVLLVGSRVTADFIIHNLHNQRHGLVVQEYIPPKERKDLRAFVLGEEVVAAMELEPNRGDFRANVHLKGRGRSVNLDTELSGLAVKAARALGLEISGTDIILDAKASPKVIEVNYSPGFRGLEAASGLDVASRIIEYAARTQGGVS